MTGPLTDRGPDAESHRADYAITGVRAVCEDRILDDATVVVREGRIAEIGPGTRERAAGTIDGAGLLLLPGFVDSHSDGLEKEIRPRRTAEFPIDYAIESFEAKLRAAGVTTVFHGIGFQEKPSVGRSVKSARVASDALAERRSSPAAGVDHGVLYRFEARDPVALDPLLDDVDSGRTVAIGTPLISFDDHTPGQGQYTDVDQFRAAVDPASLDPGVTVDEYVDGIIAEAEAKLPHRRANLGRLAPLARDGRIRLLAHDPATIDDVEVAVEAGATVAEFPVTAEAAAAARERDMAVVMGAPNALRGVSHSGNASARELVGEGLCDVLASDYLPTALLASVFILAREGFCSLPDAVRLITAGPADLAGLDDRGRLAPGAIADLVLVDDRGPWPIVVGTRRAADDPARQVFG